MLKLHVNNRLFNWFYNELREEASITNKLTNGLGNRLCIRYSFSRVINTRVANHAAVMRCTLYNRLDIGGNTRYKRGERNRRRPNKRIVIRGS